VTIDVNLIVQSFCAAAFIGSVFWVVNKIQAMATQIAVFAAQMDSMTTQIKDMRTQLISREGLEREIGALNARCDKTEKDIDRIGRELRKVSAEHDACSSCGHPR